MPIRELAPMLREIPSARLFEEVLKLFLSGNAADTFEMLVDLQLFDPLFPASAEALEHNPTYTHTLISEALINTDLRIKQNKPVTPAFLFAALLWPALPARVLRLQERGMPPIPAMQEAAHELIAEQCQRIAIPKTLHDADPRDLGHAGTPATAQRQTCRPAAGQPAFPRWLRLPAAA
nr:hypothetical protein GCM10020185_46490 [Pseudomonas brassicacearum subsp. brassicacearum]